MSSSLNRLGLFYQNTQSRLSARARRVPGVGLLLDALGAYSRDQMGLLAAALAYYFLLALFPLLLLLIAAASPFLSNDEVIRQVERFVSGFLPTLGNEVRSVLREVVNARGPATFLASIGLLWSASGVFDVIQRGIDRAWRVHAPRPLWRQRLISIVMVLLLGALFALSFASSALTRSGLALRFNIAGTRFEVIGLLLTLLLNVALFSFIYRVFPNYPVTLRQVLSGALVASVLWEIAKLIFVWYLLNFARYSLVYGSVGVVIALLTWGYITAVILLFGAEICAARTIGATHD